MEAELEPSRGVKMRTWTMPEAPTADIPAGDVEEDAFFGDDSDNN